MIVRVPWLPFCALLCSACASSGPKPQPVAEGISTAPPSRPASVEFQEAMQELGLLSSAPVDWKRVEARMSELTIRHPAYGPAWHNLGAAREELEDNVGAAKAYQRAIGGERPPVQAYESLARLQYEQGNTSGAVRTLEGAVTKHPEAYRARVWLGWLMLASDDGARARALGQDALTYNPKFIDAYCLLGAQALRARNQLRAALLVNQGQKLAPDSACLFELQGRLSLAKNDLGEALGYFEKSVEANPDRIGAHFAVGRIALRFRNYQRAERAFSAVSEKEPKNGPALANLAVSQKGLGKYDSAESSYRAAEAAFGTAPPNLYYNLGILYLRHLDDLDKAETALKTYLRLSTDPADQVFGWLKEIDMRRQMAEEQAEAERLAAKEAELQRLRDLEQAREQAALEARIAAEKERARAMGEPEDPVLAPTPKVEVPAPPKPKPPAAPPKRAPKTRRKPPPKPEEPVEPPSGFE